MTKSEIIKKLKPHCNGVVLPMSLNISVVAELLKEEPECTLSPVSNNEVVLCGCNNQQPDPITSGAVCENCGGDIIRDQTDR
jgi:hypothetical protein